jgi:hypothetical protein
MSTAPKPTSSLIPSTSETYTPPAGLISLPPGAAFPSAAGDAAQDRDLSGIDGMGRWEYLATDSATGDAFLIWKKTVQNYRFLEEDTADLALMEESFRLSDLISRPLSRKTGLYNGHACLDAVYEDKRRLLYPGQIPGLRPRLLCIGSPQPRERPIVYRFLRFLCVYSLPVSQLPELCRYLHAYRRHTPMVPDVDAGMRRIMERATSEEFLNSLPDYNNYWPHRPDRLFQDDSTGEAVFVSVETFPKYYYPRDTPPSGPMR